MNIIEALQKMQDYICGGENIEPKPLPALSVLWKRLDRNG